MKNKSGTKTLLQTILIVAGISIYLSACSSPAEELHTDEWHIFYNNETKGIDIKKGEKLICNNMYASYKSSGKTITSLDYLHHEINIEKMVDSIGKGTCMKITYTDQKLPTLTQYIYTYPQKEYILTEFTLESAGGISSNYMAPVNIDKMPVILDKSKSNRALFIPFDNDKWIRYSSHPLNFDKLVSYEVTAVFNNNDRRGLVVGSVEHDNWKTAVTIGKGDRYNIGSLVCFGGAADEQTRDNKSHGTLTGISIKSPKILIGFFGNWCNGMEEYGRVNAAIAPPKVWTKAVPFGWNSWGVLQFGLTGTKAVEVSNYIKEHLQNKDFVNADNTLYIGLDSGWNSFTEDELRTFVNTCRANGQVPGAYWTPFTDWSRDRKNLSLNKPAYASSTTHGDASLVTDGKSDTRWAAAVADNEWVYVDLGSVQPVGGVRLDWEASYGKAYKIQISNDAQNWKEVYKTDEGIGGPEEITFPEVDARYVRMFGIERGWWFGYSLWSFDVLSGTQPSKGLSDVHFIRLKLKDKTGKVISENNYWRGNDRLDFTALNSLPKADLKVSSKLVKNAGKAEIQATITHPKTAKGVAFAIHVQAVRTSDGERILPAIVNDDYFTLMPGESKNVSISFDEALLNGGSYKLVVTPYN